MRGPVSGRRAARPTAALRAATTRAALALLAATLASCAYGPASWQHRVENTMPEPGSHRFAISVVSTELRWPKGFPATFPDGGRPLVLQEWARLWLGDADSLGTRRLLHVNRPTEIRSEFHCWIVGWQHRADTSVVYLQMSGRVGETSDTKLLRWLLRVEDAPDSGRVSAVSFLPNEAVRPPGSGPLRGGRECQISVRADTVNVRTDEVPEFRPLFVVEAESGGLAALGGEG